MRFYKILSGVYNDVFPLSGELVSLVGLLTEKGGRVLDVGCARGELVKRLRSDGFSAFGLEYEEALLGYREGILLGDMHYLPYISESFNTLVCTGNTLAHADSMYDACEIMREFARVLKKGGQAVIQILNYEMILKSRPEELPAIKSGRIRFERGYEYKGRKVKFTGNLIIDGISASSEVMLYPLTEKELRDCAQSAGLHVTGIYGGFDRSGYCAASSFPLIAILGKYPV